MLPSTDGHHRILCEEDRKMQLSVDNETEPSVLDADVDDSPKKSRRLDPVVFWKNGMRLQCFEADD